MPTFWKKLDAKVLRFTVGQILASNIYAQFLKTRLTLCALKCNKLKAALMHECWDPKICSNLPPTNDAGCCKIGSIPYFTYTLLYWDYMLITFRYYFKRIFAALFNDCGDKTLCHFFQTWGGPVNILTALISGIFWF